MNATEISNETVDAAICAHENLDPAQWARVHDAYKASRRASMRRALTAARTNPGPQAKQIRRWIVESALALDAATVIGQRSRTGLNFANHDRLIAEGIILVDALDPDALVKFSVALLDSPERSNGPSLDGPITCDKLIAAAEYSAWEER